MTQAAACAGRTAPAQTPANPTVNISELWVDPIDLPARDLFYGVGGSALAPQQPATYEIVSVDSKGFSSGYDVRDREGTAWSVKLGSEAQSEVAASRILWAIGYHQPATYLVKDWALASKTAAPTGPARFRREQPTQTVVDEWSWHDNPFVGTQPFRGLLVANLMLNNWDWKTSNNKVYEVREGGRNRRMYVVRDLGASLGKTSFPAFLRWTPFRLMAQGSRNNVEDFEAQGFIKTHEGDDVEFDYQGLHSDLLKTLTAADVNWTCRLLARVSDAQWDDAFRSAGYTTEQRQRFVAKLKTKIHDGLAAAGDSSARVSAFARRQLLNPA